MKLMYKREELQYLTDCAKLRLLGRCVLDEGYLLISI